MIHHNKLQLTSGTTRGPWKLILDEWFTNRTNLGRGGTFSTMPLSHLTGSLTYRTSALPKIWKRALEVVRELPLQWSPQRVDKHEVGSHPLWHHPHFKVKGVAHQRVWDEQLDTVTLRDVTLEDEPYPVDLVKEYIETEMRATRGEFQIKSSG